MGVLSHARAGARRYRALLALPGARWPVAASALASMPIGMFGLAILLLAREATGSFAVAGRVVGAFALANAVGAVAQGRLMDRLGQPQVPAAMRSLWGALVEDEERRQAAYALVAIVFEVTVMAAPALVALLVAVASPSAAVLVAAAMGAGGALGFAATGASRGWRGARHDAGWLGPLSAAGMRAVFAVMGAFGAALGVLQVALPAFADERGSAEGGGLLLAALSAGSLAGGIVYGARRWPGSPPVRLAMLLLGLGGGCALLSLPDAAGALVPLLVATGLLIAPIAVLGSTLLDTAAPPGTVTEAFAVMVMGIVAGTAAGNALGGAVVDGASYDAATLAACGLAALGAAGAAAGRRLLAR